ncbi:ClpP/crotonase-like domain-containing protein [Leptodontidium sp. MPI-SDFR-AT-0119]|nr:ClpP/crotonase-like domain-containing protein [Leptodontidium sp. MPI-SDFR-AT-0119]
MGAPYLYEYFNVTFPQEYVVHVEINREKKLNAFFDSMWLELKTVFYRLSTDSSVRVIIFTGAGERAFTAGLDVQAASDSGVGSRTASGDGARAATALRRSILDLQDCVSSIEKCEKPVICILHGFSLGLAIDLAVAADIRLCTTSTRFAVKEVDIGAPADAGTLSRLPKVVGSFSWVKDVCLSARMFDANEALSVGLVSGVFVTKEEAFTEGLRQAGRIARKSPIAVQGTKELLNWSRDRTVADGLRYTSVWNSAAAQSKDFNIALLSGLQKRTPRFEKL